MLVGRIIAGTVPHQTPRRSKSARPQLISYLVARSTQAPNQGRQISLGMDRIWPHKNIHAFRGAASTPRAIEVNTSRWPLCQKNANAPDLVDEPLAFGRYKEHRQVHIRAPIGPGQHDVAPHLTVGQNFAIAHRNNGEPVVPGPRLDRAVPPHPRTAATNGASSSASGSIGPAGPNECSK